MRKKNNEHILEPNKVSNSTIASMKVRILSAIVGLLIVVPSALLGNWFIVGLVMFLMFFSMLELINCAKQMFRVYLFVIMLILSFLLTFWPIFRSIFDHLFNQVDSTPWRFFTDFNHIYVSVIVLVITAFLLFLMVVLHSSFTVRDACFIFTMIFMVSLGLQCLLYLRFVPMSIYYNTLGNELATTFVNRFDSFESATLVLFVALSCMLSDTGAYFIGIYFGKNKMNERISPKKTWEGFFGGLITSSLICSTVGLILAHYNCPMVVKVFDLDHWYNIVALSLMLPITSTLGDFVFSSIKRFYEIKDFGKLIPGHGGILDRIDSLLFSMITASIYVDIACSIVFKENILL